MWGRLVTCGRLEIGLLLISRKFRQADFQSAAGCHPNAAYFCGEDAPRPQPAPSPSIRISLNFRQAGRGRPARVRGPAPRIQLGSGKSMRHWDAILPHKRRYGIGWTKSSRDTVLVPKVAQTLVCAG